MAIDVLHDCILWEEEALHGADRRSKENRCKDDKRQACGDND